MDDYIHFFCVGVVYSGEYDICDVTLSVYPHLASLKNMSMNMKYEYEIIYGRHMNMK